MHYLYIFGGSRLHYVLSIVFLASYVMHEVLGPQSILFRRDLAGRLVSESKVALTTVDRLVGSVGVLTLEQPPSDVEFAVLLTVTIIDSG